jgi:hypothetical protein
MSSSYMWCEACNKQHESRETCPKGWVRGLFTMKYVSPEEFERVVMNLNDFMSEHESK